MHAGNWLLACTAASGVLVGVVVGTVLAHQGALSVQTENIPVADLAMVCVSIIALIWAPLIVSRLERRGAFDRQAVAGHLTPARAKLLEFDDEVSRIRADNATGLVRDRLVSILRDLRVNLEHARRIATRFKWPARLIQDMDSAAMLARRLHQIGTGDRVPLTDAPPVSAELHEVLIDLMRSCA